MSVTGSNCGFGLLAVSRNLVVDYKNSTIRLVALDP